MLDKVQSSEPLLPVRAARRNDGKGTDVWLRKNIQGPLTDTVEGLDCTYYTADEAFIRLDDAVSVEAVEADFESYWQRAEAYDPHAPAQTQEDRIAALEKENAMLTECLLEMSEIVYA